MMKGLILKANAEKQNIDETSVSNSGIKEIVIVPSLDKTL